MQTIQSILELREEHKRTLIAKRLSSLHAIVLLDYLYEKPHLTIKDVADHLAISYPGAKTLVDQFVALNILREVTGKTPR